MTNHGSTSAVDPSQQSNLTNEELAAIRRLVGYAADIRAIIAQFRDVIERYSNSGEILAGIPSRLLLLEAAVREGNDELANLIVALDKRLERIEQLELMDRTGFGGTPKADKIRTDIEDEHRLKHLREMYTQLRRKLSRLQEQAARFSEGDRPVHLITGIEDTEQAIKKVEEEMKRQ